MIKIIYEYSKRNLKSNNQALKYRPDTDKIVRPIRQIVQRKEETTGHFVQREWNWGFVRHKCIVRPKCVRPKCDYVRRGWFPVMRFFPHLNVT